VWTRSLWSIHPNENYPIIAIQDRFAGPDAQTSKIFSFNLMATGDVDTPAGTSSPPLRSFQRNNELPSTGNLFKLHPGIQRLGFTGQWLIDWDLYAISSAEQEAQVGNWAHGWHPSREQAEFAQANGRQFEERQHILRIKGTGPFQTLILPYRKGQRRSDLQVKQDGTKVIIETKGENIILADNFYAYGNSHKRVLATVDDRLAEANGISAVGGPTEIIVEPQRVSITAHGKRGMRKIRLPGTWNVKDARKLDAPLTFSGGTWLLDYQEQSSVTVTLER
jgi:hypothetical protein